MSFVSTCPDDVSHLIDAWEAPHGRETYHVHGVEDLVTQLLCGLGGLVFAVLGYAFHVGDDLLVPSLARFNDYAAH